jgi:transportin-3
MSLSFEATGISSYLWIAGKLVTNFGDDEDSRIRTGQKDLYERATAKVFSLLQEKSARDIPDGERIYIVYAQG